MSPRRITHQNIFRVLLAGFGLVIALLLAAALVGVRNIDSIQQNAASLVREQSVTNRLIDELHSQQTSLSEVFSVLARDPDSVDYDRIMSQLDEADRDIDRISAEGAQTPERDLWTRLRQTSVDFSREARRLLAVESPETFPSLDLFRDHEAFICGRGAPDRRRVPQSERRAAADRPAQHAPARRFLPVRRRQRAAGAGVRRRHGADGVAADSRNGMADRGTGPRFLAHAGRPGGHRAPLLPRAARRAGAIAHRREDQPGGARFGTGRSDGARLADCLRLVDEAIGNVRQMSQLLRPTILDDFGLEAGLRWLAEGFSARTGIDVDFDSQYSGRLPDETETHLFRIAQEALTNVARHSGAQTCACQPGIAPAARSRLTIQDDGRGLPRPPAGPPRRPMERVRHLGMIGMRARARSAGGDVAVQSHPGKGVLIEVRVPAPTDETHPHPAG